MDIHHPELEAKLSMLFFKRVKTEVAGSLVKLEMAWKSGRESCKLDPKQGVRPGVRCPQMARASGGPQRQWRCHQQDSHPFL